MIPLKDDNPRRRFPVVTLGLIIANVLVFLYQASLGRQSGQEFVFHFGAVPALITQGENLKALFTCMFVHGGFMHLGGNMLYLWIFGDNVENILGPVRFILFYLFCGLVASFSHIFIFPHSTVPMVGASGAISGVLGAYMLKFPRARILVLIPLFFWYWRILYIPAIIVLGIWFLIQLFSGVTTLGLNMSGGIAWFAHIGGFLAGIVLVKIFEKKQYVIYR